MLSITARGEIVPIALVVCCDTADRYDVNSAAPLTAVSVQAVPDTASTATSRTSETRLPKPAPTRGSVELPAPEKAAAGAPRAPTANRPIASPTARNAPAVFVAGGGGVRRRSPIEIAERGE